MADLTITLKNLLQSLSYQYAMASKKNAKNIEESASKNATSNVSSSTSKTTTTSNTSKSAATTKTSSTINNLQNVINKLKKQTSDIDNASTITNDMILEFFKSYKNSTTTSIYNKLKNGSNMTDKDLENFQNQVAKMSSDEKKLWKSEISQIESQIKSKIIDNSSSVSKNNTSSNTASTNSKSTLNGFINNILYSNGEKFSGIYTDGKYYQSGLLASGSINGKLYINGELYTGTKSGIYYKDGVAYNGTLNGYTYENGVKKSSTSDASIASSSKSDTSATASTAAIVKKETQSNGDVYGYNSEGNLVYLQKNVNGKSVIYTDELKYLNTKTLLYLKNTDEAVLSDRLLSDIQIVKNAEAAALKAGEKGTSAYQNAYDASIKSQMIKTTSNMTGAAGEVVEKNGSLYVNDGDKLVKLNISANTYLELFPPVDRYDINQNSIADCYFVSGCLTDMLKNGKTYAQLLQCFSEDSAGNVTVKFSGSLNSYPVTFANGQLKTLDGYVDGVSVKKYSNSAGSTGTKMLEQAYAIAKFSQSSNKSVNSIDIDEATASISKGGWQSAVYNEVLGISSEKSGISTSKLSNYLDSMASKVNNGQILLSLASYGTNADYNLKYAHAYSIEKIDTANKVVYISNPWYSGGATAIPYSVLAEAAYTDYNLVYFSIGNINS